jgi:hypothetical protein
MSRELLGIKGHFAYFDPPNTLLFEDNQYSSSL